MLHRRLALEWAFVFVAASLLVGFAAAGLWTRALDNRLYDAASYLAADAPDDRILIVEIDDASLRQIGRWPWSRDVHRKLLDTLAPSQPRAIGYDVLFLEPEASDAGLASAMRRAGPVFLPGLVVRERVAANSRELTHPVEVLAQAAGGVGVAEVILDEDGLVRRGDLATKVGERTVPQIAAMIARKVDPKLARRPGDDRESFLLPLSRGTSFRRVSFANVVRGEVPGALIRDRIVLIGATAEGMGDIYPVPSSAGGLMPGVQIQANLLSALLSGHRISQLSVPWFILLSLVPTWLMLLAFLRLRPATNLRVAIAAVVGIVVLTLALIPAAHLWFPPGAALMGVVLVYALWGWRRLAAVSQFMGQQAVALQADPGMTARLLRREPMSDPIAVEVTQLEDIISQLRTLRQFTADVVERLPDATLVIDEDDSIILANEAALRLFGSDSRQQRFSVFLARICEGADCEGDRISRPGGPTLVMTDAPLSGGGRIVRLADMTDLQRATDEREEVLQFLSHDLRSPHAAILTLLETGEMEAGQGVAPRSMSDRIRAHARHGLRLADDFVQLARARRRPIDPYPIDLSDVAREAIDMVWPKAVDRSISIVLGGAEGETWVMGDHAMLLRATVNLLDNAVKFAPDEAQIDVIVSAGQAQACLSVSGPGPDMPPGRAGRPFALYAEGRDVGGRESIGLGLALVHATATRHGGTAHYHYEAGFGATFSIILPLAAIDD